MMCEEGRMPHHPCRSQSTTFRNLLSSFTTWVQGIELWSWQQVPLQAEPSHPPSPSALKMSTEIVRMSKICLDIVKPWKYLMSLPLNLTLSSRWWWQWHYGTPGAISQKAKHIFLLGTRVANEMCICLEVAVLEWPEGVILVDNFTWTYLSAIPALDPYLWEAMKNRSSTRVWKSHWPFL